MRAVLRKIKELARDRRANVAVLTGLCALPLVGIVGLAVDYSLALAAKSKLDAAADAAVIAAISKAKTEINAGVATATAISDGQTQGQASFRANVATLGFGAVPVPNIQIVQSGQTMTASVSYSTASQNQFGRLFGTASTQVSGTASSSSILTPYYQFIFVVDISGSMSIGGTTADINGLVADPRIQCAFACHDPYHNRSSTDYRAVAKQDGWTLKIDYVNQAIRNFISDLQTQTANVPGVFSVGIDTFATSFYTMQTPTSNLSAALTVAGQIDIEPMQPLSVTQGYTRTTTSLASALGQIGNIGDGSSAQKQMTYVILLTDGVEDIEGNEIYGRGTDVNYTGTCATVRNAGATMITILAPYPAIPANQDPDGQYRILIAPLASQLAPAMLTCASGPTWNYQATDGPGINSAVQAILQQVLSGVTRLTQ